MTDDDTGRYLTNVYAYARAATQRIRELEARPTNDYATFLERKRHSADGLALDIEPDNPYLFDFQRDLVRFALNRGRAALFCDTGMGKTLQQLTWADAIVQQTGANVLVLAPLAVSHQTIQEGEKFGIEAHRSHDGRVYRGITVTNYEQLHRYDPADFGGVVCDESAILKSFDGVRRAAITAFMRKVPYRLLCSATPAPNDYTELGTSSEALGYLGHIDMLNRFFVNDNKTVDTKGRYKGHAAPREWRGPGWRFKGHAEEAFWRWVTSWARAIRKPSDMGYPDDGFILPPLTEREHVVTARRIREGMLFAVDAISLEEQREERRRTIVERCERVAELVDHDRPALVWCHLNDEGDRLERLIPDAVQVSGSDSDEVKEERLLAFVRGEARVLVTKPKIAGWGLNFQHCAHVTFFPSHSFEQYYQGVRRCWRYGQTREVIVDIVTTEGERRVLENLQAKARAADVMFSRLVELMHQGIDVRRVDGFTEQVEVPAWL